MCETQSQTISQLINGIHIGREPLQDKTRSKYYVIWEFANSWAIYLTILNITELIKISLVEATVLQWHKKSVYEITLPENLINFFDVKTTIMNAAKQSNSSGYRETKSPSNTKWFNDHNVQIQRSKMQESLHKRL